LGPFWPILREAVQQAVGEAVTVSDRPRNSRTDLTRGKKGGEGGGIFSFACKHLHMAKKAPRPINTALSLSFEHTLQLLGEAREPLVIISYFL